jgi:hypothetical protein
MGLSETVLAAMIGAIATVSTALFQLFSALRSSQKADPRIKRGSTARSLLSVLALMVASGVGGFLYSEFLKQRSAEEMRAMRDELREVKELAAMAAGRVPTATAVATADMLPVVASGLTPPVAATASVPMRGSAESLVYVPACSRPIPVEGAGATSCAEAEAQRVAVCSIVPAPASIQTLELFAQPDAVQQPWERHAAALEQDLGGARFTGKSFEYAQSDTGKAVCVNFMHWSSDHPHLARLVVHYVVGNDDDIMGPVVPPAETPSLPLTADSAEAAPQSASFIASGAAASQ